MLRRWLVACLLAVAGPAAAETVELTVTDATTGEVIAGATVISVDDQHAEITDENGHTVFTLPPGPHTLQIYYGDSTFEHHVAVTPGEVTRVTQAITPTDYYDDPI